MSLPIVVTVTQSGNKWNTPPIVPTYTAGSTSYSQSYKLLPPPGQTFPASAPTSTTVSASDGGGSDSGSANVTSSTTSEVTANVTVTCNHSGGFGSGLSFIVSLDY